MNRRTFIRSTTSVLPLLSFSPYLLGQNTYPIEELTGKKRPPLYGKNFLLRKEVAHAFEQMQLAAKKEGIRLYSASSYRSFEHQERIWNYKYKRYTREGLSPLEAIQKIIQYSTIPGTSRHHWGTDLDIIDLARKTPSDPLLEDHYTKGTYHKLYLWLQENASRFGFYETYTNEPSRKGFCFEPWHYSYADTSVEMMRQFLEIDIREFLRNTGLLGGDLFTDALILKYRKENILGINDILLP